MRSKLHTGRRKSVDPLHEIGHLYDKLVYWLYQRQDAHRARSFADRLGRSLKTSTLDIGTIFAEDCWSLIHEAQGNLPKAIKHRLHAIRLIRKLHKLSENTPHARFVFRQYSYTDLRDELESLAMLYHDSGDLNRAIRALEGSKQLCIDHGLTFDAGTLLSDYLKERRSLISDYPNESDKKSDRKRRI